MKILTLDIETAPNLAHVWGIWQQNIAVSQLRESGRVISFSAKWYDGRNTSFFSDFHDGHDDMLAAAFGMISAADVLVHYNGDRFDLPWLNTEFELADLGQPRPCQSVDLLKVVKKRFRFPSNKLGYVAPLLLGKGKVSHTGHELWVRCLANEAKAWETMRRYNINDVRITERLYTRLRPWIANHPSTQLHAGFSPEIACPNCNSKKYQRRGYAYTAQSKFPQYRCNACGRWFRDTKAVARLTVRGVA